MGQSVNIVLPWSCIVSKNRKYTVTRGRMILSKAYRDGKEAIRTISALSYKGDVLEGDVSIQFDIYVPDKRERDILNVTQIICDGIEGVVFRKDSQIKVFSGARIDIDRKNPRVEITVNAK